MCISDFQILILETRNWKKKGSVVGTLFWIRSMFKTYFTCHQETFELLERLLKHLKCIYKLFVKKRRSLLVFG